MIAVVLVAFLVAFWLKQEWDNTVVDEEIKYSIELADLKQGQEFQFGNIPWGASLKEVKALIPYSLQWRSRGETDLYKAEQHLFMGKSTSVTLEFRDDMLFEVELSYAYGRRKKKVKGIVEEITELFGPASKIVGPVRDITEYEHLYYYWETDNTMLNVDFRMSANVLDRVTFCVRSMNFNGL